VYFPLFRLSIWRWHLAWHRQRGAPYRPYGAATHPRAAASPIFKPVRDGVRGEKKEGAGKLAILEEELWSQSLLRDILGNLYSSQ